MEMARKQSHILQSPGNQGNQSEWFRHNYPDVTLGDMANYYRSMQQSVPYEKPDFDGYAEFYEKMSGRPLDVETDSVRPSHFHHLARYTKQKRRQAYVLFGAVVVLTLAALAALAWVQLWKTAG
jgi:hypothetical protein